VIFHKKATYPTPDGKIPEESRSSPKEIQKYLGRISGPLLDRIDLHVEVPAVPFREISSECKGESSTVMAKRVNDARHRQYQRFAQKKKIRNNAALSGSLFKPLVLLEVYDFGPVFFGSGVNPEIGILTNSATGILSQE